jgi:hypothetical protein
MNNEKQTIKLSHEGRAMNDKARIKPGLEHNKRQYGTNYKITNKNT